jgi:hypothetical protein
VSPTGEVPSSVLLLVGREDFTPPRTFAGGACVATHDCLAVAVGDGPDGRPDVAFAFEPGGSSGLVELGRLSLESEGLLSLRDVYDREHESAGVGAGLVEVTVLGDHCDEPSRVRFVVAMR